MGMIIKRGKIKSAARIRRHERIRKHVSGTTERPRLVVTRSARHIVAQIVDDTVGELIATRAKDAGVDAVVFDRGGNKYHGRVAAVADGARAGGLSL